LVEGATGAEKQNKNKTQKVIIKHTKKMKKNKRIRIRDIQKQTRKRIKHWPKIKYPWNGVQMKWSSAGWLGAC
jgi:hypothetical protein